MSPVTSRRLIACLLLIAAPWPMLGPFDVFVPSLRYAMLALAASAVGLSAGAAGALPQLIGLLVAQAIGTILLSLGLAWLLAKPLARLSSRARSVCVLGAGGAWLLFAVFVDVYRTGLGDTARATLLGVLFS
jgi:hypothetical protein